MRLLIAILACLAVSPAFAADVTIPYGEAIAWAANVALSLALPVAVWMGRHLPAWLGALLGEQLLSRALSYGVNAVAGAAKGRSLTVPVGNEVIAKAAQYAIDNGAGWLIKWMGGQDGIRKKIIARMDVGEEAAVASSGTSLVVAAGK